MLPKKATAAVADDTFAVLLRYAEFSGEELSAPHAATAAGIGRSTAFRRVADAKAQAVSGASSEDIKCTDTQAFTILLKYAEASGKELQAIHAAKATGIGRSTAFRKIKEAKEALEAGAPGVEGESVAADASTEVKSSSKKSAVKTEASPTKESKVNKKESPKKSTKVKKEQSPALDQELDNETPSNNDSNEDHSPTKSIAAMPSVDTFAILLRYADLSGEKLKVAEAAAAAGISTSTANRRVAKAKEGASNGDPIKGGDVEAFQVLMNYAAAIGVKLQVAHAAKAAGVSTSTANRRIAAAKGATATEDSEETSKPVAVKKKASPKKKVPAELETDVKEEAAGEDVEGDAEELKTLPKSPKKTKKAAAQVKNEDTEEPGEDVVPFLAPPIDIPAKSPKKSPTKGGAIAGQDTFAVLIRYAEFSGEKLIAAHAAAAAGIAERTAFTRISKAKKDLDAGVELPKGGGADAFPVLLKYSEASGMKLVASHAAKAAGIAQRTAFTKIAQAKKALQGEEDRDRAESPEAFDGEDGAERGAASTPQSSTATRSSPRKRKAVTYAEKSEVEDEFETKVTKKMKFEDGEEVAARNVDGAVETTEEGVVGGVVEETAGEAEAEDEGIDAIHTGGEGVKDDSSIADVFNEIEKDIKDEEY